MCDNNSVRSEDDLSSKMTGLFVSKGDDSCSCRDKRRCKCKQEKKCKERTCIEVSDSSDYDSDCDSKHRKDCQQKKCNCQKRDCNCGKKKNRCSSQCVPPPSCPPPRPPKPSFQLQSGEIPFSASVTGLGDGGFTSAAPIVMSYGNNVPSGTADVILPSAVAWVVPFDGVIKDLAVGADLHVVATTEDPAPYLINTVGYEVDFTVMISPSTPNTGIAHPSVPYAASTLTSSVRFGFPNTTTVPLNSYWTGTNLNPGLNVVHAGDRVTLQAQTNATTNGTLIDIDEIQLSGSLFYQRNPPVKC